MFIDRTPFVDLYYCFCSRLLISKKANLFFIFITQVFRKVKIVFYVIKLIAVINRQLFNLLLLISKQHVN